MMMSVLKKTKYSMMVRMFAAVFVSLLLAGCSEPPAPAVSRIPAVKTQVVAGQGWNVSRTFSAVVEAGESTRLAFPMKGTVAEVNAEIGDSVEAGKVLAALDPVPFDNAVRSASAQVRSAQSSLLQATEQYRRLQTLYGQGIVPKAELDKVRDARIGAESSLDLARTQLENAREDRRRTSIVAPFSGRISARSVERYAEVNPGDVVFELVGLSGLKGRALVPEGVVRELHVGGEATVSFPTLPGVGLKGTISEIGAVTEAGNAFPVYVTLDEGETRSAGILVGMAASVSFRMQGAGGQPVFLVPVSALAMTDLPRLSSEGGTGGRAPIYIFDAEAGKVSLRLVEVQGMQGNLLAVSSGLTQGEEVVVAGASFLKDGMEARRWVPETPREEIDFVTRGTQPEKEN
ncbi:RND family efflux transporter MFP subunit [Desulfobaculum xiamenense]|uniref:RND family efflux transporter MFP subunit n=1 Tax=Desulfobaculum xiamenense TaxID=995050 RepID=A0A846QPT6_9BACT|nr:efflux RND transporter periplasmic adaptor subunit [Desulfobaculum xiamenense]NJB68333.1 RND family efflux transporter MFP subunit [Desulfobaculum xiamenense]